MRTAPMLQFPLDEYEQRINNLYSVLEKGGFTAALLTNEDNLRYFCDYRSALWNNEYESPAMLVAVPGRLVLVTSTRTVQTALATCCLDEGDIFAYDGFGEAACPEALAPAIVDTLRKLGAVSGKLGTEIGPMSRMRITYNDRAAIFDALPGLESADVSVPVLDVRGLKSPRELEIMRENCRMAVDAFKIAADKVVLGETTEEDFYHNYAAASYDLGADDFALQLVVEFGPDRMQPNGVAGPRGYSDPDWCIFADSGPTLKGYASDMIRMAKLAPPTAEQQRLMDIVLGCHALVVPMIKPGTTFKEVVEASDNYMREKGADGFCMTIGLLGHGFGQDVHEPPMITLSTEGCFKKGMVFTLEPTLLHPTEGQFAIENNYTVTEDGCELLTPQLQGFYIPERS